MTRLADMLMLDIAEKLSHGEMTHRDLTKEFPNIQYADLHATLDYMESVGVIAWRNVENPASFESALRDRTCSLTTRGRDLVTRELAPSTHRVES